MKDCGGIMPVVPASQKFFKIIIAPDSNLNYLALLPTDPAIHFRQHPGVKPV